MEETETGCGVPRGDGGHQETEGCRPDQGAQRPSRRPQVHHHLLRARPPPSDRRTLGQNRNLQRRICHVIRYGHYKTIIRVEKIITKLENSTWKTLFSEKQF